VTNARAWYSSSTNPALPSTDAYGNIPGGDRTHPDQVQFSFEGQPGNVVIAYEAYDIDRADEVRILVNGQPVG